MTRRAFHAQRRPTTAQPMTGRSVISFGARIGYWPCLKAPFVSVTFWKWNFDVWHGLPSRKLEGPGR